MLLPYFMEQQRCLSLLSCRSFKLTSISSHTTPGKALQNETGDIHLVLRTMKLDLEKPRLPTGQEVHRLIQPIGSERSHHRLRHLAALAEAHPNRVPAV